MSLARENLPSAENSNLRAPETHAAQTPEDNFHTRPTAAREEFARHADFFKACNVRGTFVVFGSARAPSQTAIEESRRKCTGVISDASATEDAKAAAKKELAATESRSWCGPVWELTRVTCRKLSEWSMSEAGVDVGNRVFSRLPANNSKQPLCVCSGGGPGFMEAANLGASEVPGSVSMGVGIQLPFETKLNDYVSSDMGFTSKSFYSRKYWETYAAKAMICAPGGMGTLDEMFEVMTLMQCFHAPKMPVVLLGKEFWTNTVNFKFLAERGMISQAEVDAICITDDADEALNFIVAALTKEADAVTKKLRGRSPPQKRERDE